MLDDKGFAKYAARLRMPRHTVTLLNRVRSSPPRAGQTTGRGSVLVRAVSDKMGHVVAGDARSTEGMAFAMYEWTPDVYEFWPQAVELRLAYRDREGRGRAVRTRVDVLVLEAAGAFLDEWKTDEELLAASTSMPGRYVRERDGWRSPPAEEAASKLGLQFRLRTPAEIPAEIARNASFLRDYWRSAHEVEPAVRARLLEAVSAKPGLVIADLLRTCPDVAADDLYLLVARGELYVDLARHRLAATSYTPVFPSESVAIALTRELGPASPPAMHLEPGTELEMDSRRLVVVEASPVNVTLRVEGGALLPLSREDAEARLRDGRLRTLGSARTDAVAQVLRTASPKALAKAQTRLLALRDAEAGKPSGVPGRTLRRWARNYRAAKAASGDGFAGLVMGEAGRPRGSGLEPALRARLDELIGKHFEVADPPTLAVLHATISEVLSAEGFTPPGPTTLARHAAARDQEKLTLAQAGRKMAYQERGPASYLAFDAPAHGERPWERAHLDHTQIDLWLVDSETGLPLARPWLTLMVDEYSRRVLAYWLTFDPPSYRSLMMVFRDCVRRWRRLPETIVVDDGAEFASAYFEQLLARFRIDKLVRRGDPRVGGVIERLFGTTNTRLWHALLGQTRPTKNVRGMSPEVDPQRRAAWSLPALGSVVEEFYFERYDTTAHPAFGASPRAVFDSRLQVTGQRPDRFVADDEAFFFATLPTTDKGFATVVAHRGVKINHRWYAGPELRDARHRGAKVPIRHDPMDVRHAYVYLDRRWIEVFCPSLRRFPPVSEREVAAISAELDQRARRVGRSRADTAADLASFLARTKQTESVLLQQRRDAEVHNRGNRLHRVWRGDPQGRLRRVPPGRQRPVSACRHVRNSDPDAPRAVR